MIYFIQSGFGPIKIGFTDQEVYARIADLQTGSPYPLRLLGIMEGTLGTEKAIHEHLSESNLNNEWFMPTEQVIMFINKYAFDKLDKFISSGDVLQLKEYLAKCNSAAEERFNNEKGISFYLPGVLSTIEHNLIMKALEIAKGKQYIAARLLGIDESIISRRLKQFKAKSQTKSNPTYTITNNG